MRNWWPDAPDPWEDAVSSSGFTWVDALMLSCWTMFVASTNAALWKVVISGLLLVMACITAALRIRLAYWTRKLEEAREQVRLLEEGS